MKTLIMLLLLSTSAFAQIDTDSGAKATYDGTAGTSAQTPDLSGAHSIDTDSGARATSEGTI